jgi:hypothetical protein
MEERVGAAGMRCHGNHSTMCCHGNHSEIPIKDTSKLFLNLPEWLINESRKVSYST